MAAHCFQSRNPKVDFHQASTLRVVLRPVGWVSDPLARVGIEQLRLVHVDLERIEAAVRRPVLGVNAHDHPHTAKIEHDHGIGSVRARPADVGTRAEELARLDGTR